MSQPIIKALIQRSRRTILSAPKAVLGHSALTLRPRLLHSSLSTSMPSKQPSNGESRGTTAPVPPEPRENSAVGIAPSREETVGQKRLADFDLAGRVFIVTGGARGLGLSLAEALVETGGKGEPNSFIHFQACLNESTEG